MAMTSLKNFGFNNALAGASMGSDHMSPHEFRHGVDLRITPANGGTIISVSRHHNQTPDLYIVSEDKDLGAEIGKIITLSCLKEEQ